MKMLFGCMILIATLIAKPADYAKTAVKGSNVYAFVPKQRIAEPKHNSKSKSA